MNENMNLQEQLLELQKNMEQLEKKLAKQKKINKILVERVERSVDSVGSSYSMFEQNILLQQHVDKCTKEIEGRKQAEEMILNSEKRYKYLFEQSPISIWEEDFSGAFQYIESLREHGVKDFEAFFNENPQEINTCSQKVKILDVNNTTISMFKAGSKKDFLKNLASIFTEDSLSTFKGQMIKISNRETSYEGKCINKTFDGRLLNVSLRWNTVPGHEKDYSRVLVSLLNETEKEKAIEALRDNKERLQMLNKIIRHDLSNDFTVISSAVKIFKRNSDVTLLDEIEKRVEKSLNAIAGYRKSESYLDSNTGFEELDLLNVINSVAVEYPKIKFKIEGAGRVFGDETLISVFENLVSNSIKHGKASQIDIKISDDNDMRRIEFADNGTGIPEEIKENVFDEGFHHGESGNTGIGLHIVKDTIERYGGEVFVEDNKPKGTIFVLMLKKNMKQLER
ncbi:MAG: HAMP domain-containing sensor histidine kinase [Candidatus Tenebribacter davisii]|jgi:K+-sensing histidine kinase KdpD|nr:HAMP domain-containing sensor histidine kinase [Candidatus Tenebribacter davisii]